MARTKQVCRRNPYPQLVASKRHVRDSILVKPGAIKIDLTIETKAVKIDLTRDGGMKMDPIVLSDDTSVEESKTEEESLEASIDPEILYTPPLTFDLQPLAYEEQEMADNWFTVGDTDLNHYDALDLEPDWNLLQ